MILVVAFPIYGQFNFQEADHICLLINASLASFNDVRNAYWFGVSDNDFFWTQGRIMRKLSSDWIDFESTTAVYTYISTDGRDGAVNLKAGAYCSFKNGLFIQI